MHIPNKNAQQSQWHLVPISGFSEMDVKEKSIALTRFTQQNPQIELKKISALLGHESVKGTFRKAIVANSTSYLAEQLTTNGQAGIVNNSATHKPKIVFMFTGIGDHYVQMGRGLYEKIPYFRDILDKCAAELRPYLGVSITELLYPQETPTETASFDLAAMLGRQKPVNQQENSAEAHLQKTEIAHPLVFSIEYALSQLLQHWGVRPDALIGYSLGEYVAATIAGVLSLEEALLLVAKRAQLIQALPLGKMLAIPLSKTAVTPYLNNHVSLSAHNGQSLTILAGETEAILSVQQQLLEQQIACRLLDTTHAFHSHMMQPATMELTSIAQLFPCKAPQIPYLSNVTGNWITAKQAADPTYWSQHMCQPVQWFTMLQTLLNQDDTVQLIEIGPGQSLSSFVKQHPQCKQEQYSAIHPTLRYSYDQQNDHQFLLSTLQKLWLSGIDLNWNAIFQNDQEASVSKQELPLILGISQPIPQKTFKQKDRGEKRRQNRLSRRKRVSG